MDYALSLFGLALITSVFTLQSVIFAQFNNDSLENTIENADNIEIGPRIFGFEEAVDECSRVATSNKEKKIGVTFYLLCQHFGPTARDEIVRKINVSKEVISPKEMKSLFMKCLDRIKLNMIWCFEIVFDGYDLAGHETPPDCMRDLAIFPEEKYQIFWLKKFPLILEFLNRVIKGYKTFNPARVIVDKYIKQGLMERWQQIPHFDYAKTKIEEWNSSGTNEGNKRLKEIIGDSSDLLDICEFSNKWLQHPRDFEDNICLRKMMGNLLILETYLQQNGVTLETEFIYGRYLLLHLLQVVKSVIRLHKIVPSRRGFFSRRRPNFRKISQLNDLRAANVKCLDELRRTYDEKGGGKLSEVMKNKHLQQCLDTFVKKTEVASKTVKKTYLKQTHARNQEDIKKSEKNLIKNVIKVHNQMKPLKPVIQDMVDRGVPSPSPEFPWANKFIEKFKTSTIADNNAKLANAHFSSSYSSSSSCKHTPNTINKNSKCWSNYVTQNMIIEKELQNDGLTLQQVYLGNPARLNMIYYIDESLHKNKSDQGRIIAQHRRSLTSFVDIEAVLEKTMNKLFKNSSVILDD